nr:MAG: capsid protein precursor [Astroviridae sp.]
MEKPKPQRVRRRREEKTEVKIEVKEKPRSKKTKEKTVIKTKEGLEHQMMMRQDRRKIKQLERRVRKLGKEEKGPKVNDVMHTTLTLGVIPGTDTKNLCRMRKIFANPALLKPMDAEQAATPLSIRASQYDLWKPAQVVITFRPLTGSTVVTGSILFCDLDQDGAAAKPETVDTVKARPHAEVTIGQLKHWKVPRKYLVGPRNGWWYVDTNENPTQSLGPAFNIWLYMSTRNVFSAENSTYNGPLFLAEMNVTYHFSNYNPKPGMQTMVSQRLENTSTSSAEFTSDIDGSLILRVPANSQLYDALRVTDENENFLTPRAEQNGAVGAKIWSLASDAVEVASTSLGPWGWLLKGGWFLLRRIFNLSARANQAQYFKVYASVEDARADQGIHPNLPGGNTGVVQIPQGDYFLQQITEPNVGGVSDNTQVISKTIQPPQDYLPLAYAVDTIDDLPPVYLLNSQQNVAPIDSQQWGYSFILAGSPEWWMHDQPQTPGTESNMTISFQVVASGVGAGTVNLSGKRIVCMDFTQSGVIFGCNGIAGMGGIHTAATFIESIRNLDAEGTIGSGYGAASMFMKPYNIHVSNGAANWLPFEYNITQPDNNTNDNIYVFDLRYEGMVDSKVIGVVNLTTERLTVLWIGQSQSFYPNSWFWFANGWAPFGLGFPSYFDKMVAFTLKKLSAPPRTPVDKKSYLGWVLGPQTNVVDGHPTARNKLPPLGIQVQPETPPDSDIETLDAEVENLRKMASLMLQNPSSRV